MNIIAFFIGIYGYILPGNINLMFVQLAFDKKINLFFYVFIAILFEIIYILISFKIISLFSNNYLLLNILHLLSLLLLLFFAIWILFLDSRNFINHKNVINRGLFSIIIHPQQIYFWILTSNYIDLVNIYSNNNYSFLLFILSEIMGVLLIFYIYITFGKKVLAYFEISNNNLNKILGIFNLFFFIYGIVKFYINIY